jgi:hypothetical protein
MLATLGFLADLPLYKNEQPYQIVGFQHHDNKSNGVFHNKEISAQDARDKIQEFKLKEHGFQFVKHALRVMLTSEDIESGVQEHNTVVSTYIQETTELVRTILGASKAICFDWRVRNHIFLPLSDLFPVQKK